MRASWLLAFAIVAPAVAQDAYDLPWRISPAGELEVRRLADAFDAKELQFGEWTSLLPGLFAHAPQPRQDLEWLGRWGPMIAVPLLVHGEGGAAAIDEATLRMRKLGIATTVDYVPLIRLKPDALTDLLHVRHLASFDLGATFHALREFAKDMDRDPFVRAAAAAALAARPSSARDAAQVAEQRASRNGGAALQSGLAHLPDDVDLVLGIHGAALPPTSPLLSAWREFAMRFHSSAVLRAGGSVSSSERTTGQLLLDRPGQLPFEIARRCGNWRVDHAMLALRGGDKGGFWLHAGGVFHPTRIAAGLREGGFDVHTASGDEVRATVHGVAMRVTKTELVACPEGFEPGACGSRVPLLHDRAAPSAAPIWLHIPPTSRFTAPFAGCAIDARFDPARATATANAACPDAGKAMKLLAAWEAWRDVRRCDANAKIADDDEMTWGELAEVPAGYREESRWRLTWRRLVQATRVERREATLTWSLELPSLPLVAYVFLLAAPPTVLIEKG
jgi:hypothetical protein